MTASIRREVPPMTWPVAVAHPRANGLVRPDWPRSSLAVAARGILRRPLLALLDLIVPVEVHGREHIDRLDGPALLVANHTSHLDTLAILRALPELWRRRLAVGAAADYFFDRPLVGVIASLLVNAFPFPRTMAAREGLVRSSRLLADGWSVLLFPEGTRSATGRIASFRGGIGRVGITTGVPVVPIYLTGLFDAMPRGCRVPRRHPASVTFGSPLTFAGTTPGAVATAAIEAAVRALAAARAEGAYPYAWGQLIA